MSSPIKLTNQQARRFYLAQHALWPPRRLKGKQGILDLLSSRLGCIQFDSINVTGRNADLMLQSRVHNYYPGILEEMLYTDRSLIDGWDKVAAIFPIQDWPYFFRRRDYMRIYHQKRLEHAADVLPKMVEAVRESGPTSSLDFKDEPKVDWYWGETKLARAALEALYKQGRLVVHHRVNTRRYFDLAERLVPGELVEKPDPFNDEKEYHDWHVLRRLGGMGLASARAGEHWLGIVEQKAPARRASLQRLVDSGQALEVLVEDMENETLYMRAEDKPLLEEVTSQRAPKAQAAFITPLDNMMWQRKLIAMLFNFDYVWEVYKPKKLRQWGYYVLPVLYGDRLIARIDPFLDRNTNTLQVKGFWWEADVEANDAMIKAIQVCLKDFMRFLDADDLLVEGNLKKEPLFARFS